MPYTSLLNHKFTALFTATSFKRSEQLDPTSLYSAVKTAPQRRATIEMEMWREITLEVHRAHSRSSYNKHAQGITHQSVRRILDRQFYSQMRQLRTSSTTDWWF